MRLLTQVYQLATHLPTSELYGLSSQLRRAALSIPSNIAEGFGRRAPRELSHFLSIAEGSLREIQTLLDAIALLGYLSADRLAAAVATANRVGYLLHRFRRAMKSEPSLPRSPRRP